MQHNISKKLVILGGGTAGWMAAAAFAKFLKGSSSQITLIESDQIGTIGVGEATVPGIHQFNQFLGISELDFIKSTQATFKLGILFQDWYKVGENFFHPFAKYGAQIDGKDFFSLFHSLKKHRDVGSLEEFCLATQFARSGKFVQPDEEAAPLARFNYAYHFDASLYARFLRQFAEGLGVARVEGKFKHANICSSTGQITALALENGELIEGDIFIDCTGFSALLISKVMGVDYVDWSHWLKCDRAVAAQSRATSDPVPFTRSRALAAGWQWTIPLQHRVGNGYVYSSAHISDDEAAAALRANIEGELITEPRVISFTAGMRRKFIEKNCIALGLASGFIEPLESTSISLIQTGIEKVLKFFPSLDFEANSVNKANDWNEKEYSRLRDFIILHYKLNQRGDNNFWENVAQMDVPELLALKMRSFKEDGTLLNFELETFLDASWQSMYNGFNYTPLDSKFQLNAQQCDGYANTLRSMQGAIRRGVEFAPTHADFLKTIM